MGTYLSLSEYRDFFTPKGSTKGNNTTTQLSQNKGEVDKASWAHVGRHSLSGL